MPNTNRFYALLWSETPPKDLKGFEFQIDADGNPLCKYGDQDGVITLTEEKPQLFQHGASGEAIKAFDALVKDYQDARRPPII